jgi:hypothetical protein
MKQVFPMLRRPTGCWQAEVFRGVRDREGEVLVGLEGVVDVVVVPEENLNNLVRESIRGPKSMLKEVKSLLQARKFCSIFFILNTVYMLQ